MNMKKALNNVVLDDKIQKHNRMKEGLHVVIWGDKCLKKSKMEWKKKPWIFVVHCDMNQMQNNEDEKKSLQSSYSD